MPTLTIASPVLKNFGSSATAHSASPKSNESGARSFATATATLDEPPPPSPSPSSVASIKEDVLAKTHAVRGASTRLLLNSAREFATNGFVLEGSGDLRSALRAFLTSTHLAKLVLEHEDFRLEERGRKGVVWKETVEFQQKYGNAAVAKVRDLEARLLEMEKAKPDGGGLEDLVRRSGGGIQDRLQSLREAGLALQTTKRVSRDLSARSPSTERKAVVSIAISRTALSSSSNHKYDAAPPIRPSPSLPTPPSTASPAGAMPIAASSPATDPLSSLSSLSSSPPSSLHTTLEQFEQSFPSIEALDKASSSDSMSVVLPALPSVPTFEPGKAFRAPPASSPSVFQRFPPIPLDIDKSQRPASTPVTPSAPVFPSGPPSPSQLPPPPPRNPYIPPKPANLTLTGSSSSSRTSPVRSSPLHTGESSRPCPIDLPVTSSIRPKVLHDYLKRPNDVSVLLLDIRVRDEFARAHIKNDHIVCLEPQVLLRDGLTSDGLEDALSVAPPKESELFRHRDEFDLVVMYDGDSESFGPSISPMSAAVRIVYETAFRKMLKRNPVILVGGIKAWWAAYPAEIARDERGEEQPQDRDRASETKTVDRRGLSSPPRVNGTANAVNGVVGPNGQTGHSPVEIGSPTSHTRPSYPMQKITEEPSAPSQSNGVSAERPRRLVKKPTITRPPSSSSLSFNVRGLYDNSTPYLNGSHATSASSIVYPQYPRAAASSFGTSLPSSSTPASIVSPPLPTASVNASPLSRRRDYIDQSEQAVSSFSSRPSIDYPDLSVQHVVRPPPVAASPANERKDGRRSSVQRHPVSALPEAARPPRPPTIHSDYPVVYWPDVQIAASGMKNLGNTCYMNSTVQCLSATVPFARFFTEGRWKGAVNALNSLGSKGQISHAFASILHDLWHEESVTNPVTFRRSICMFARQFSGSEQHDSQEFLSFLLDSLHEDLNRVLVKPPIVRSPEHEAELEKLPQQIASQQEWNLYRTRDDSVVVDFFQGQFRNRMECLTCQKTSTTYNSFMYLQLPIPNSRGKISLKQCLDTFVQEEVLENEDAWHCPNCKTLRKATKRLSISRLPPVLLIQFKRFRTKGHFTDKVETFVDFPVRSLDMTNYMPPPLPPGADRKSTVPISSVDDAREQFPPYRYDLYAVTNHYGTLSSGHYTAFVNSRGSWIYCDDSHINTVDSREVVGKPAYVLYYKRVRT